MRLLTIYKNLREDNATSQFEVQNEVDLEIPPQSSLALINANLKYNDDFIEITPQNDEFNLFVTQTALDNDDPFRVSMNTGTFNATSLLENLQQSLNSSLEFQGNNAATAGLSTSCFYKDSILNIAFGKAAIESFDPVLNDAAGYDELEKVGGPPFGLERKAGAGTNNWNGFALMDAIPINKGASEAQFNTTTDISPTQFFAIGLLPEKVDYSTVTELPPSSYAVSLSTNADMKYELNGVETATIVTTTDDVRMRISEGTVFFTVNGNVVGEPVPYKQNLGKADNYVHMSLFGADARLNYFKYHEDPFFGVTPSLETTGLTANPNTVITIDWTGVAPNSDLGEQLGFTTEVITLQGNQSIFNATNALNFEIAEDAGVNILIDNLPLKSYNFTSGVERSQPILHHIPEGLRDPLGVVSYIPPYIVPVDLNNNFPLNLRSLRISIRNAKDNSLLRMDEVGMSVAVLTPQLEKFF
jgi:hypothetical protein